MSNPLNTVLHSQVQVEAEVTPLSSPPQTYTYYHAGPLFNIGDLGTNVRLSQKIHEISRGKYQPILPQDLEQRDATPHSIRDEDIKALLRCDMALFTYDGTELDSGTVVEYMVSKFADMPTVILRTDFRGGGDQGEHNGDPWNLMSSSWPRTVGVVVNSMVEYKTGLANALRSTSQSAQNPSAVGQQAAEWLIFTTARRVVDAFDKVSSQPSRMPQELKNSVYQWLALMPGFKFGDDKSNTKEMLELLQGKTSKGLM